MDEFETVPAPAVDETHDDLSATTALRDEAEAPAPEAAPAEPAATEEAPEVSDEEAETRRNALLREIAMDPGLTQQYVQQQYQPPVYAPAPAPAQYQEPQAPELPFDEFSFDPNNPEHHKALITQIAAPLFDQVQQVNQRFQQEEQARQAQQMQAVAQQANEKAVAFLDTYVPGFAGIADKLSKGETLKAAERAVFNEAVNAESAMFNGYAMQMAQQAGIPYQQAYDYVTHNVQIRAQIAQQIGPQIKTYAKEIGLVSQPTSKPQLPPEAQKQMKREMYVESSNAVPAANAGGFEKALESGDAFQMIRALRT